MRVLLSWLCDFYHSGERDVGFGGRMQVLGHSQCWDQLTGVLSAFRAGRKELRLTSGKMLISRCTKLQTGLDSCSKSFCRLLSSLTCVCVDHPSALHDRPSISPISCSVAWLDQSQMQEEGLNGPPSSTARPNTDALNLLQGRA